MTCDFYFYDQFNKSIQSTSVFTGHKPFMIPDSKSSIAYKIITRLTANIVLVIRKIITWMVLFAIISLN